MVNDKKYEKNPLCVVVCAVVNNDKICLIQRRKKPFKNYWGMIGGKLKFDESIADAGIRETKEESGLDCEFKRVISVLHERVVDNENITNSIVIFFVELQTKDIDLVAGDEGDLQWFDINCLPEKLVLSDRMMIDDILLNNSEFGIREVIMKEKGEELIDLVCCDL